MIEIRQDEQCRYKVTLRRVRVTNVAMAKQCVLNTECLCVCVALNIQHTKRMRNVTLSSVAYLVLPYFFTLSQKRSDVREYVTEYKTCVLLLIQIYLQYFSF